VLLWVLAFAFDAVQVAILFARNLRTVPDQETGVTGEFICRWRNDLNDQFFGHELSARGDGVVQGIGLVQLTGHASGIRGIRGLQCLQGVGLSFLDIGTYFVVIGCH